jgi:hypothetical protein
VKNDAAVAPEAVIAAIETAPLFAHYVADKDATKVIRGLEVDTMPALTSTDARAEWVISQAVEFALKAGCKPEDAAVMRGVLEGDNAPCELVTWDLRICNLTGMFDAQDMRLRPITGFLTFRPKKAGSSPRKVELRPQTAQDRQILLGICIDRRGGINAQECEEQSTFKTYAVISLQTVAGKLADGTFVHGLPLVLAYDVDNDGQTLTGGWSRRLYYGRQENPVTGRVESVNRLANLNFQTNLELDILGMFDRAGFPIRTARIRQRNNGQVQTGNRRPAASLVGAAATTQGYQQDLPHDPFAG